MKSFGIYPAIYGCMMKKTQKQAKAGGTTPDAAHMRVAAIARHHKTIMRSILRRKMITMHSTSVHMRAKTRCKSIVRVFVASIWVVELPRMCTYTGRKAKSSQFAGGLAQEAGSSALEYRISQITMPYAMRNTIHCVVLSQPLSSYNVTLRPRVQSTSASQHSALPAILLQSTMHPPLWSCCWTLHVHRSLC